MRNYERHIVAAVMSSIAVYLKSPYMLVAPVLVYALGVVETLMSKATKDAEIISLVSRAEAYEKRLKVLEQDVVNVAERAKTILGETY